MKDAVQDNCILTVINLSKSKRNLFIQKNVKHLNMNLIHGIVYSAFFPNKECRKLFQYDAFHKELRLLSCSIPDKSFLAKELGIHGKDIHTYNYKHHNIMLLISHLVLYVLRFFLCSLALLDLQLYLT